MTMEMAQKIDSIMIIDDSDMDRVILAHMVLKVSPVKELFQHHSAREALAYLKDNQENIQALPDVIFLDVYMPVMSGFDFLEAYEKLSSTLKNHCKIFIVTSTLNDKDIQCIRSNKNVVRMLEKPLTQFFLEEIRDCL